MKVLFVNNSLRGLVYFRLDVIRHLQEHGHEVVAVVPSSERNNEDVEGLKLLYVPLRRTSKNPFLDLVFFFSLIRIFICERPHYAFLYTIKPNIYGTLAARLCRVPSSMMMAGLGYVFLHNSLYCRIARGMYRIAMKYSEKLLLLNEDDVKTITKLGMCRPYKIIHLESGEGVNLQHFSFYDNTNNVVRFLFVGRLVRDKGIYEYLEAVREIKQQCPKAAFLIAGDLDKDSPGCLMPEELNAIVVSNAIEYIGHVNMAKLLKESGIVMVIPSYHEGLCHSLMEGCAAGKPIITTNISGCREMVIDGVNGYLVPVRQPHALAEAMLHYMSLTDDEKQRMSLESRRLAESHFDVRRVFGVYDSILKQNARGQVSGICLN